MNFSSAVKLADVNDFLNAGSACIFEEKVLKKDDTGMVEIRNAFGRDFQQVETSEKGVAKLTLDNCLACSGCITSAETVLVESQSMAVLLEDLQASERTLIVTISPHAVASFAMKFEISLYESLCRLSGFFKTNLNAEFVFDTVGALDIALLEAQQEFVNAFREQAGPVLCSECPGWICFAEKELAKALPRLSSVKSPQQIMGTIIKRVFPNKLISNSKPIYHCTIMPCYDKKLEASREQFRISDKNRDVDLVISPIELEDYFEKEGINFLEVEAGEVDQLLATSVSDEQLISALDMKGSGGYLDNIFLFAARELFGVNSAEVNYKRKRNDDLEEVTLEIDGKAELKFLKAYGFKNIQNVTKRVKRNKSRYHYIEIMACPSGCGNGSAMIRPEGGMLERREYVQRLRDMLANRAMRAPEDNEVIQKFYSELDMRVGDKSARDLFHTTFQAFEPDENSIAW